MKKVIRVIVKNPGESATDEIIPNTLKALQDLVGGHIEVVKIFDDAVIICNEEGRLMGLPHNCEICGCDFVGTIVIAGTRGEDFTDVPLRAQMAREIRLIKEAYE